MGFANVPDSSDALRQLGTLIDLDRELSTFSDDLEHVLTALSEFVDQAWNQIVVDAFIGAGIALVEWHTNGEAHP